MMVVIFNNLMAFSKSQWLFRFQCSPAGCLVSLRWQEAAQSWSGSNRLKGPGQLAGSGSYDLCGYGKAKNEQQGQRSKSEISGYTDQQGKESLRRGTVRWGQACGSESVTEKQDPLPEESSKSTVLANSLKMSWCSSWWTRPEQQDTHWPTEAPFSLSGYSSPCP